MARESASDAENRIKIDAYNHYLPPPYLELLKRYSKDSGIVKRMASIRVLWDIEARVELLGQWPEVRQILTLGLPHPEGLGGPAISTISARTANDGMAEACRRWPEKFPAFVASLPMNDVPAALEEMDRAIGTLGARGIQIGTNILGRPLDEAEFFPVFERMANHHRLPIWMHPLRQQSFADYRNEPKSRYEIWQVLGWPYETSAAMARIVFSGLFDRLPELRIITHHCGGMLPYFSGRAGLDFFGTDRVVFASDCPFDPEGGAMFIREGIRSIADLCLPHDVERKIYYANAIGLMRLPPQT
jgi:predicted TIM-barrel fold metal-dependent hydrolase